MSGFINNFKHPTESQLEWALRIGLPLDPGNADQHARALLDKFRSLRLSEAEAWLESVRSTKRKSQKG